MATSRVGAILIVLVLSVGCVSGKPGTRKPDGRRPANFVEGVWIKKYPRNYACFKLETPDGFTIVCDPFGVDEKVRADIVTESHQDYDHADTSMITGLYRLYRGPGEFPGEFVDGRIFMTGVGGRHNKTDAEVTNTMFFFSINGIRFAHFASQGQVPTADTWKRIDEMGGIDVLLIQAYLDPAWKDTKMTLNECCAVIDRLDPRIVIPEHGTPGISRDLARHYTTQVQYTADAGFVVTNGLLESITGRRIVDMDNNGATPSSHPAPAVSAHSPPR